MSISQSPTKATPLLELESLAYQYGAEPIFSGLSWRLDAGSRWSLLGSSGEGKSTLLAIMAGALAMQAGQMRWKGAPYAALHDALLGKHPAIGYLAQQDHLQEVLSVVDNLRQAQRALPEKTARAYRKMALERLGLTSVAEQPVRRLSGGQRQRAALAALLAGEWGLILLDEPFGELDFPWRIAARRFLEDHAGKAAVVLVSHDPSEALPFARQVAFLQKGRLHFPGSPRKVYHHPDGLHLARITGEVNELDASWQRHLHTEETLLRPSHLVIDPDGERVVLKEKAMGAGGERWWIGQPHSPLVLQMAAWPHQSLDRGDSLRVSIKKPPR